MNLAVVIAIFGTMFTITHSKELYDFKQDWANIFGFIIYSVGIHILLIANILF